MKKISSAFGALVLIVSFATAVPLSKADVDPVGCSSNGGGISLGAFRSDGVTSIGSSDTVTDGELIKYQATLSALGAPNCAFEGGTWTLTTPNGTVNPLGAVPRIGGTGVASLSSGLVSYTVVHLDEIINGNRHINATTAYGGGKSHADANDTTDGPTLGASKIVKVIHTPTVDTKVHDPNHGIVTTVPVGTTVHDSATVTGEIGGPIASGSVTFTRYSDVECLANPIVSGTIALVAGVADPSTAFTTNTFGAIYYKAHYNGQAGVYNAADGPCEPLEITKVTPQITTTPSDGGIVGVQVSDQASISVGFNPTGDVTFKFYPAGDTACELAPIFTDPNKPLVSGKAQSGNFTPPGPGTYHWTATYNGDTNNNPVTSDCADETVVITKAKPSITTTLVNLGPINVRASDSDSSTLTGATTDAGGTVTYTAYTDSECSQGAQDAGTKTVVNHIVPNSNPLTFNTAGDFYWQAVYSGDDNNEGAISDCTTEHLVVTKRDSSVTTKIQNSANTLDLTGQTITPGRVVHDNAFVIGSGPTPTGTVDFDLFSDSSCNTEPTTELNRPLNILGVASSSPLTVAVGSLGYIAHYSGDGNYNKSDGTCESLTVEQLSTQVTTEVRNAANANITNTNIDVGTLVHDHAVITQNGPVPTGTVNFGLYNNGTCNGDPASSENLVTLSGGAADSTPFTPASGSYGFKVTYSGDTHYSGATGVCEPFTIIRVTPQITTLPNPTSANVGDTLNDSATLSGGLNPTGSITFDLYRPADSECLQSVYNQVVPLSGNSAATSPGFISDISGLWHWSASYSGDGNNNPISSNCNEPVTVNKIGSVITTHIHNANHDIITGTTVDVGTVVHDQAVVTDGITASGSVNFQRFSTDDCTGDSINENNVPLDGSGIAESTPFTPVAGSVSYLVHYNGDAQHDPSDAECEVLTVQKLTSHTTTEIHNASEQVVASVPLNTTVHDKATVTGGGPTATGNVDFTFYLNGSCANDTDASAGVVLLDGSGIAHPSNSEGPLNAGPYSFKANYEGDGTYNPSDSDCEPLTVNQSQSGAITQVRNAANADVTNTGVTSGTVIHDHVVVTGNNPTGNITFNLFNNGGCTDTPVSIETPISLLASGSADSTPFTPASGSYSYLASYGGDNNNQPSTASCEPFTVIAKGHIIVDKVTDPALDPQSFAFTTTGGIYAGFTLTDAAVPNNQTLVAGTYSVAETPLGGWTQTSANCDHQQTPGSIVLVDGLTVTCTFTNTKIPPPQITTVRSSTTIILDGSVTDSATITGINGVPITGTVTFFVCPGSTCTSGGTQVGGVKTVNGNSPQTVTSDPYTPATLGTYTFRAEYSGDANYPPAVDVNTNGTETFTVSDSRRMTGGGSIFTAKNGNDSPLGGVRVTHGFELHCDITQTPNNLEINWNDKTGKAQRFHLDSLISVLCTKAGNPAPPKSTANGFNTYTATGIGGYNGVPGATISFVFTDLGEPGKKDTASYEIKVGSTVVLEVSAKNLDSGNQQAH